MSNEITLNGKKYVEKKKRAHRNPSSFQMQPNLIYQQTTPFMWKPQNQVEPIYQQLTPYSLNTYHQNPAQPRFVKKKARRNPADAATLVMVVALAVFVWYLHDNNMIKFPWEGSSGSKSGDGGNSANPGSGAGAVGVGNPFPSLNAQGVSYQDVFTAFSQVAHAFELKGYIASDWHNVITDGTASPYDTISSIAHFRGSIIPANPGQGGIDPQVYVSQYNHSMQLIANLPGSTSNRSSHNSKLRPGYNDRGNERIINVGY